MSFNSSSADAKKQKQYLKEILSNSLALMESLNTEKKEQNNTKLKPRTEGKEHSITEKSKHIEPTKQATQKPSNAESKHVRHTTEQLNVKPRAASTRAVENTPRNKNEPTAKKGGISDDMEKQIEEAEAEIQQVSCMQSWLYANEIFDQIKTEVYLSQELEIEQREDEKKRKKHEETKNEEATEKKEMKEKSEEV